MADSFDAEVDPHVNATMEPDNLPTVFIDITDEDKKVLLDADSTHEYIFAQYPDLKTGAAREPLMNADLDQDDYDRMCKAGKMYLARKGDRIAAKLEVQGAAARRLLFASSSPAQRAFPVLISCLSREEVGASVDGPHRRKLSTSSSRPRADISLNNSTAVPKSITYLGEGLRACHPLPSRHTPETGPTDRFFCHEAEPVGVFSSRFGLYQLADSGGTSFASCHLGGEGLMTSSSVRAVMCHQAPAGTIMTYTPTSGTRARALEDAAASLDVAIQASPGDHRSLSTCRMQ